MKVIQIGPGWNFGVFRVPMGFRASGIVACDRVDAGEHFGANTTVPDRELQRGSAFPCLIGLARQTLQQQKSFPVQDETAFPFRRP
ncbi:hypothetical protein T12_7292 [Trichinella patagoniensis]|uniref:Uncharacterized protein n=1 Tax=Trichinella patagoniensis TaxID=990121 RepID=A0A0V0Z5Z8_9BILA|nr:hypothetical protein T12_7292 [Trichinella patagoniensis]